MTTQPATTETCECGHSISEHNFYGICLYRSFTDTASGQRLAITCDCEKIAPRTEPQAPEEKEKCRCSCNSYCGCICHRETHANAERKGWNDAIEVAAGKVSYFREVKETKKAIRALKKGE